MKKAKFPIRLLVILLLYTLSVAFAFQYFYRTEPKTINSGLTITPAPDVAVASITSKTIIGKGYTARINVTTANYGLKTETFDFTLHINTTLLLSQTISLDAGGNRTITALWNTTEFAKAHYSITAYVTAVPEEIDLSDNTLTKMVLLTKKGDVNGDGLVNVLDLIIVAQKLGTNPRILGWNPNADIREDNTINVLDLILVAQHLDT